MLISVEDELKKNGVYDMSLEDLVRFKDKVCNDIKYCEDNRYMDAVWEMEMHMNPKPSYYYCWRCDCLIEVCEIIIGNSACTEELKKICEEAIENARAKIEKGLYDHPLRMIIKKDNVFCREVVAHYLLKENPSFKNIIDEEVDRWIDYHNSVEFKKSIIEDAFMIRHYQMGLEEMILDYLREKVLDKNKQ